MEHLNANNYIETLKLSPHVETGFFRENYVSPAAENEIPSLSSAYYLLKAGTSTFFRHLSQSDESVCYHEGKTVEIMLIDPQGNLTYKKLGRDLENGEIFQVIIPKNYVATFKTRNAKQGEKDFSLFACVCGPAYKSENSKLIKDEELMQTFPNLALDIINSWRTEM